MIRTVGFLSVVFAVLALNAGPALAAGGCDKLVCSEVDYRPGALTAAVVAETPGGGWVASNAAPPEPQPYRYRLSHPCVVSDGQIGACRPSDFRECPAPPDRVMEDMVIERQRLVLPGNTTIDGYVPLQGEAVGEPTGNWASVGRACIDITALNPPPSPDEVFRYFQTLPLPQLPTKQQPPGNGLVGLPVIFFTDGPTTQTFTLDIRGFTVDIVATASGFTWHTGDSTDLTTTNPGAPYPNHTISHNYASGTYTASLTTTWTASFRVDGGTSVPVPVPGSTTTDGPPVTFDVLQARPVLTNPYD